MRNFFIFSIVSVFISNQALATCNWEKDIRVNQDGSYTYSKDCHVQVGVSLNELDLRRNQVAELNKAIELKDLAIKYSEERAHLWMDSSLKMNERLNQYEASRSDSQWLHFGLGVATTVLSVWAAGQLSR
jgi:hypothetical protein